MTNYNDNKTDIIVPLSNYVPIVVVGLGELTVDNYVIVVSL